MARLGEEELEAVARVLRSGNLSRYSWGRQREGECDLFERELERKLGVPHAVLLSSGTNALISALAALGVGPGDEVIVPAYTYIATAGAVLAAGAVPVVANIDESLTLCPEDLARRITPRTKAVIPVHMSGLPCDLGRILELARARGLHVIEDACQAIGGTWRGRPLGTWGDAGCFSFNNYKILTCGEGGALVTGQRALYERAFIQHDMGINFREYLDGLSEPVVIGSSMRVSEISGAIMRVQLGRLDALLAAYRERKRLLQQAVADLAAFPPSRDVDGDCGTTLFLSFPAAEACRRVEERLRLRGVFSMPVSGFYRHLVTSWEPVLARRAGHHPARNPYALAPQSAAPRVEDYRPTLERLERTLLLFIDPHATIEATRELGGKLRDSLGS